MIADTQSNLWFSYKQKRYNAKEIPQSISWLRRIIPQSALFSWSDTLEDWDWNKCHFTIIGMDDNRVRIVARRQKILNRTDHLSGNEIWLMLGIKITNVGKLVLESYNEPVEHNPPNRHSTSQISRWTFHMDVENSGDPKTHIRDAVIWAESDAQQAPQEIVDIRNEILQKQGIKEKSNIFDVETDHNEQIFPVIYPPRVDTHNNYIRSIFWERRQDEIVFSVVFNDEELNRAWFLDYIYRHFRRWKYGRIKDLESFNIILQNQKPVKLKFPGIYSNDEDLKADSTHGDKEGLLSSAPERDMLYFYSDQNHPVIFVNTSNHAMAEKDNNPQFWKWEYVAWGKDTPLVSGGGSKETVDAMLREMAMRTKPCNIF